MAISHSGASAYMRRTRIAIDVSSHQSVPDIEDTCFCTMTASSSSSSGMAIHAGLRIFTAEISSGIEPEGTRRCICASDGWCIDLPIHEPPPPCSRPPVLWRG